MPIARFNIKAGNTAPSIVADLTGPNDVPADLTGASVEFFMRPTNGVVNKIDGASATVVTANPARVQYDWISGDTDTPGVYEAEWKVTYADGSTETFPNTRENIVVVHDSLG